jgi:hypothetical protein
LLGSLTKTYLPSGIFMQRSVTVLTMPQPFASETLSCAAKSVGRTDVVLKMTCLVLSLGLAREMYLKAVIAGSDKLEQKMIIKHQWINTNA